MGRNVFSGLGHFLGIGIRRLIPIIAVIIFASNFATADDDVEKGQCILTFSMPFGVVTNYKVTDISSTTRINQDSSVASWADTTIYYLTRIVKNPPQDGFQFATITVDSVLYFAGPTKGISVEKSQSVRNTCLDGKTADLTYSPYGEIAKIEGKELEWVRNYVEEGRDDISEVSYFDWQQCLSDSRIAYIFDMKKILIPQGLIPTDTIWTCPIEFYSGGTRYSDTVACKIVKLDQKEYNISTSSLFVNNIDHNSHFYGIEKLGTINSAKGTGSINITLSRRGSVSKTSLEYMISTENTAGNMKFKEKIHSQIQWEVLRSFKYE